MQEYVSCIDGILKEFNQPEFYRPPEFHVSLIWCLANIYTQPEDSLETKHRHTIDLERDLQESIEEINEKFGAALDNGEVGRVF